MLQHKQFANGFQVIYEKPDSNIPISSVHIFVNLGNIHSPHGLNGVTHFIEHMCFKGTSHHPDFNKIVLHYTDIGATWNAYSFQRYTVFVLKCQDIFLPHCIKLLAEELLTSKFALTEFKKEEKVVIAENIMMSDDPKVILEKMTNRLLYENTLYEYPIDDIAYHKKKYDYKTVVDFYKQNYVPSNMIFSITSNVAFSSILNTLKKTAFHKGQKPVASPIHSQLLPYLLVPPRINGVKYEINHLKKLNSIFLNVAFQTCNQYNDDKYVLNFFADILCNSATSRLNRILRQENGLIYSIHASTNYYECGGDFIISTQFNSASFIQKNKPSVLPLIIKELNHLIHSGITQRELTTFKHNSRGKLIMSLENSDTQTNHNGFSLLYKSPGEVVPLKNIYKKYYESITKAQVNACIRAYVRLEHMCVSVVGSDIPSLERIAAECNKL
jgi:predicted Zn-dependent peptidase